MLHHFQGTTGFPWIDAVMRQLRIEGWIPHVARQAVGCFLTRGCLWINWEEGFKVENKRVTFMVVLCSNGVQIVNYLFTLGF